MDASLMLKRKGPEAPEPWLDGVPVPATKIRRLDAVVPPIEPAAGVPPPAPPAAQPIEVEEVPMPPAVAANDERAIVVYQPADAARNLLRGPLRPEAPLRVSRDWIRSIKNTVLQEASNHRALFEQLASGDENLNLAMVPWAPAHAHVAQAAAAATTSPAPGTTEMMDADQDAEGASMEVEQDAAGQPAPPADGIAMQGEALPQQQWPPQHCMAPQQLQVPAASYQPSPVTWSCWLCVESWLLAFAATAASSAAKQNRLHSDRDRSGYRGGERRASPHKSPSPTPPPRGKPRCCSSPENPVIGTHPLPASITGRGLRPVDHSYAGTLDTEPVCVGDPSVSGWISSFPGDSRGSPPQAPPTLTAWRLPAAPPLTWLPQPRRFPPLLPSEHPPAAARRRRRRSTRDLPSSPLSSQIARRRLTSGTQTLKDCIGTMEGSKSIQSSQKSSIVTSGINGSRFDNDDFSSECASNHVVVSKSEAVYKEQDELGENRSLSLQKSAVTRGISPSIGAFTVQCAKCFKWRLIPTKEKYEEIRECIIQEPFVCKRAREWRPDVTCDDPEDISQDGSRLWAIDKPNIAQPPRGWERQIRIRGEGGTKFADVYYTSPTGRKLRSLVEIDRYLQENPEYVAQGITLAQFSFQIPRPLRQGYVKKKAKLTSPGDDASTLSSKSIQPEEVHPIAWAAPTAHEGDVSEEASHADETLTSEEMELTRKRKAGSTLSGEPNHLSELKPKSEDV